jgi:hypothetical protein
MPRHELGFEEPKSDRQNRQVATIFGDPLTIFLAGPWFDERNCHGFNAVTEVIELLCVDAGLHAM